MDEQSEVESLILKLSKRQQEIEREDLSFYHKVERVDKLTRFIVWLGAGLFGVGVWATTLTLKLQSIERELEARRLTVDRVNEMWWMKENGISNKDSYQKQHGYVPTP